MRRAFRLLIVIVGWSAAVVVSVVDGLILGSYTYFLIGRGEVSITWEWWLTWGSAAVAFLSLFMLVAALCRKHGWDRQGYGRGGGLVVLALMSVFLLADAPPLESDYTEKDVLPVSRDAAASCDALLTFRKGGEKSIRLNIKNAARAFTNAVSCAGEIEKAWEEAAEGRTVLDKLAAYDLVGDLKEGAPIAIDRPMVSFVSYRNMALIYRAHAQLRLEQGQSEEAARELVQLYTVARKGIPHASGLIAKMTWDTMARIAIGGATSMARHPRCSQAALGMLREGFRPLSMEDISLRKVFISEYLAWRNALLSSPCFLDALRGQEENSADFVTRMETYIVFQVIGRRNRTWRDQRHALDLQLAGAARAVPDLREADEFLDDYRQHPQLRNVGGWLFVRWSSTSYSSAVRSVLETKVRSDLLAMVLRKRLGESPDLVDAFTGKAYTWDDKGLPFSVGRDGLAGTKDDIRLDGQW
jgi:hypothetical protein